MIAFLIGKVVTAGPLHVVLQVGGIGYQVDIPVTTAEKLPSSGNEVCLYIHPVYREDSQSLYGFNSPAERDFFKLVTEKVSGIGPKIALNLMSRLSLTLLTQAIAHSDTALIAKCPGIGKKTAERLCIELSDKLPNTLVKSSVPEVERLDSAGVPSMSIFQDAVQALVTLGYKLEAADKAVRSAAGKLEDPSVDQLVKTALRPNG